MLKKGGLAQFGSDIVVILNVDGNDVFYKTLDGRQQRGNSYASQFIPLNPVQARQVRAKAVRTRWPKPIVKPVEMPSNVCPSCGAQGFVLGVRCPNCDHIQMESFRSWLSQILK